MGDFSCQDGRKDSEVLQKAILSPGTPFKFLFGFAPYQSSME
jgi:hypothetical protein